MKQKKAIRLSLLFLTGLTSVGMAMGSSNATPVVDGMVKTAKRAASTFLGLAPLDPITVQALSAPSELTSYLPTTVLGYYSDGSSQTFTITWDSATEEQVKTAGTFALNGKATYGEETHDVTIAVTVVVIEHIVTPRVLVYIEDPDNYELPRETLVIYTDGSTAMKKLDFTGVEKPTVTELGEKKVTGKLETGESVECIIEGVGADALTNVNAAKGATGKFDFVNSYDNPDSMYNGNHTEKGISNWETRDQSTPETSGPQDGFYHVTGSMTSAVEASSIIVYWWTGETNCELPSAYQLEIDDGSGTYQKVDIEAVVGEYDAQNYITPYHFNFGTKRMVKAWRLGWKNPGLGKWCNISEIEVMHPTGELTLSSEADLTDVKVNGVSIENFDGFQNSHTTKVAYDAEDVEIVATASSSAAMVYVQEGEIGGEPYRIHVLSQDFSQQRTYEIFVRRENAPIKEVTVSFGGDVENFRPGDSLPVTVTGTTATGETITSANADDFRYVVENLSGSAEMRGSNLVALTSGYVELSAQMTYGGATVTSKEIRVAIQREDTTLRALYVEKQEITIDPLVGYELPTTVKVHYEGDIVREQSVAWNPIPAKYLESANTFTIQGYVVGTTMIAELEVSVITTDDVRDHMTATFYGQVGTVPTLPSSFPATQKSDGTYTNEGVTWDSGRFAEEFPALEVGQSVQAWYYFNSQSNNWKYVNYVATEGEASMDYADRQNGYMIPASFTSTASTGESSMAFSDAKGTTWSPAAEDENPYFGFIFGNAGNIQTKTVSDISLHFSSEALPAGLTVQYFTGSLANADLDTTNFSGVATGETWESSALTNEANWKNVTAQSGTIAETTTLSFEKVETSAIRVLIDKGEVAANEIGIDDLTATEKVYSVSSEAPELSAINVTTSTEEAGSRATTNIYEAGKDEYTIEYDGAGTPTIEAVLADGERGMILTLPEQGNNKVLITLISEDGKGSRIITVNIKRPASEIKSISSIQALEKVTVDSAKDAAALNLPTKVTVNYSDGTTGEVDVSFDTSSFVGKKGTYLFNGTLELPLEVMNDLNLIPQIQVEVLNDYVDTTTPEDPDDKPNDPGDDNNPSDPGDNEPTAPEDKGGLQGGDIAAIILGVLLGLTIVGGLVYYFLVLRKKK